MTDEQRLPNDQGRFGDYGGRFVPETLMAAVEELRAGYEAARDDAGFQAELAGLLATYVGRPTPLTFAANLTAHFGGARIYLKREDLAHTGAHKINHALGQALVAQAHGQAAHHCGDGGRAARRRDGDGVRAAGHGVRGLHGHGGTCGGSSPTSIAWSCWARGCSRSTAARGR